MLIFIWNLEFKFKNYKNIGHIMTKGQDKHYKKKKETQMKLFRF